MSVGRVSVLGEGRWGAALAEHCARKGHDVHLFAHEKQMIEKSLFDDESSFRYDALPGRPYTTRDLQVAVKHGDLVLLATPTRYLERTVRKIVDEIGSQKILCICTMGISHETLEMPSQILNRVLPERLQDRLAFLVGPSVASEVEKEEPTAVTIASKNEIVAKLVQQMLSTTRFRRYTTDDIVGVEFGGALVNLLVIACGISDGLGFGHNARSALITRGLDEISRLAVKCGAKPFTLAGLSGVGNLIASCTGDLSNDCLHGIGMRLGEGRKMQDIGKGIVGGEEGILTCKSAYCLAQKADVECQIIYCIQKIIQEDADPLQMFTNIMSRELKPEVCPIIHESYLHS